MRHNTRQFGAAALVAVAVIVAFAFSIRADDDGTGGTAVRPTTPHDEFEPPFLADDIREGRRTMNLVAYAEVHGGTVWILAIDPDRFPSTPPDGLPSNSMAGVASRSTSGRELVGSLAWSPDGSQLAYVVSAFDANDYAFENGTINIWTTRLDGTDHRLALSNIKLPSADGDTPLRAMIEWTRDGGVSLRDSASDDVDEVSHSPDGKRVAYRALLFEGSAICIRDAKDPRVPDEQHCAGSAGLTSPFRSLPEWSPR